MGRTNSRRGCLWSTLKLRVNEQVVVLLSDFAEHPEKEAIGRGIGPGAGTWRSSSYTTRAHDGCSFGRSPRCSRLICV
jgi:hypothetical protein